MSFFKERSSFSWTCCVQPGISTDKSKTEKIAHWPTPTTQQQLQQFLGLASYYRRFIRDFTCISRPLHWLTEKNVPFCWTEECDNAFNRLKQLLISAPILSYPDFSKEFILDTDASNDGVGAVLSQRHNGMEHVVAYASKSLTKAERNYSVTRRELLAIVTFTNHFRQYLLGCKFTLHTDHHSLTWLTNFENPEGQLARWLEKLAEYTFEIEHHPGCRHNNADSLSHHPDNTTVVAVTVPDHGDTPFTLFSYSPDEICNLQLQDNTIGPVLRAKEQHNTPGSDIISAYCTQTRKLFQLWDQLQVSKGILFRIFHSPDDSKTNTSQLVVPTSLHSEVLDTSMQALVEDI